VWRKICRTENPTKVRALKSAAKSRRRASCVANTPVPATAKERAALISPGATCLYCLTEQATTVDHHWPIARWKEALPHMSAASRAHGPDHISNLVGSCASCNSSKGAKLPDHEWLGRPGAPEQSPGLGSEPLLLAAG